MVQLRDEWQHPLKPQFNSTRMQELSNFLRAEKAAGKTIFPPGRSMLRALELCPPKDVKVVLLGQDPYHGPGQAEGLSFSVAVGQTIPPSLVNIYKELNSDLGIVPAPHGHLEHWAKQGVLLLNSVLSVEAHKAASHAGKGWEPFTDAIIAIVNEGAPSVFFLWGAYAQRKAHFIDSHRHLVIRSPHPSPLSAHRGFFGSKPFSQANAFLLENKRKAIDWQLPY